MRRQRSIGADGRRPAVLARAARAGLLVLVLTAAGSAGAQERWRQWDADFDEDKRPWKEVQATLPPSPRAENLLAFEVDGASAHRFFIDGRSLSIGEDGVVRFTLVVKTAGGSTNTSYEGMRCETRERRHYAVGHARDGWVRARDTRWQPIEARELNNYYRVLFTDFFCPYRAVPDNVAAIVRLLEDPPRPQP